MRFYGSALGYLWSLARPFAFFGVVYFVFTVIARWGDKVKNYGVCVLFGLVLFTFFAEVTNGCVVCLPARENLLRKMQFPRLVVPLSIAVTGLLNLASTLVAVFIFTISAGIYPMWSWLELIPLIGLLAIFATGVGMLLSVLYVRYRDVQPIWEVVTQTAFYASPILYVATMVPEKFQRLFLANPIASILTEIRHAVIDPSATGIATAIGGTPRLLIPLAIIFGSALLGALVFRRQAPDIAERL